jgi:hypothetical protein
MSSWTNAPTRHSTNRPPRGNTSEMPPPTPRGGANTPTQSGTPSAGQRSRPGETTPTHGSRHAALGGDIGQGGNGTDDDDLPDPQSMIEKSQSARRLREGDETPEDDDTRLPDPEEEDSFRPSAPKFKTIAVQVGICMESSYIQPEKCLTK